MAGDNFDWNVVIRLALQGDKQARQGMQDIAGAADNLNRQGKLADNTLRQVARATQQTGSAAGTSARSVDQLAQAEKRLASAQDNQKFEARIRGMDLQAQSAERLSRAQSQLVQATSRTASARASGDPVQLARALREQESATKAVTAASQHLHTAQDRMLSQANSIRYANYDVASTMFTVSAAITAAGTATVIAAARQERAFADVERTTTDSVDGMKQSLTELSTEIPFAFTELAKIATLGNQLGVPAAALEDFTKTIATFSTVTGITAEESAQAFGKLGNLLGVGAEDYDRLASSIALVGRTTAATEKQIISVAGEIAPAAAAAGFTADQVVGLSGALASLKVPPERSRSTILQFFETLNMAVARGGDDLDNFAAVVGMTSEKLESMVRSGQGKDILSQFVSRTATADTIEITQALDALGLAGLRTNPTIRALAGDMEGLNAAMADGKQGYDENTELQRQMAIILDTLSAKWQLFLNAVTNAAAAVGSSAAPALKNLLDITTDLLVGFAEFAQSPIGEFLIRMGTTLGIVVAGYAALRGGVALATASMLALQTATRFLGGAGLIKGVLGLAQAMGIYSGATAAGTGATLTFSTALKVLGRVTIVGSVLMALSELIFNTGEAVEWLGQRLVDLGNFLGTISLGIPALENGAKQIQQFGQSWVTWGKTQKKANDETWNGSEALADLGAALGDTAGDLGDFTSGLDDAATKVRTLVDYSNDLKSVWDRAFEIRFGGQTTLDAITTSFNDIRKAAADAAANIRTLKADIGGLQSDINIQEYFLGIAVEYGDSARAEAIQANIAKLQADLAKKTEELSAEQQKNSRVLTGNSQAAIQNRGTIQSLVQQYQAHIGALASSGMGQEELSRRTAELQQDFINQATQLGYNTADLQLYTVAFQDVKTAIDNVPRDLTVSVDPNPAITALNEIAAKAQSLSSQAGAAGRGFGDAFATGIQTAALEKMSKSDFLNMAADRLGLDIAQGRSAWRGPNAGGSFAGGGYTGRGGKYDPAGIVHRGEYVVPKQHVNQRTGLPKADALGRLQRGTPGRSGYAGGGFVGGGGGLGGHITSFGPMAQQQLMASLRQIITVDGKVLAESNSRQYAADTATGAR